MEKAGIQKFYKFTSSAIIDTFGIKTVRECAEMNHWLDNIGETVDDFENKILDIAIERFAELGKAWNEEELKMHCVCSPIHQFYIYSCESQYFWYLQNVF